MNAIDRMAGERRSWWRNPGLQDAALAAALIALCVLVNSPAAVVSSSAAASEVHGADVVLWWIATAFIGVAVALRRRWPLPMLVVCTLATAIHLSQGKPFAVVDLGAAVLLYTVALRCRRAVSVAVLIVLLLLVAGWNIFAAATGSPIPGLPDLIPSAAPPGAQFGSPPALQAPSAAEKAWTGNLMLGSILVASWATGHGARSRRAYLDELHARARDLEHQRDQQAELAIAAERARITRELHDVVAHGLSVMVTQAQGAEAALDHRLADTRAALAAVIKTGRDSLTDMRRVLAQVDGVQDAWHPQPGLSRLPALISQVTAAGTPVQLYIDGTPIDIPSAVDLSAYRIVQEALTNTMKHAGPGAKARVTITYRDTDLEIEVSDNGHGTIADHSGGNGLRGMRERVGLLGGQLTTGPTPISGFTVRAVLPVGDPNA